MSLNVFKTKRPYETIYASELFSIPQNRTTFDPYRVDEIHSTIIALVANAVYGNVRVKDIASALHQFEVEKPEHYV